MRWPASVASVSGGPAAPQQADGLAPEADEPLVPVVGRRAADQACDAVPEPLGEPADEARVAVVVERDREQRDRHGDGAVPITAAVVSSGWDSPPMARKTTAGDGEDHVRERVPDRRRGAARP